MQSISTRVTVLVLGLWTALPAVAAAPLPGTHVYVCPDDPEVIQALEPLLDWRRRQGYACRLVSLDETGGAKEEIKAFLQSLFDTADPPLQFVTLVGDADGPVALPTWHEDISGFAGEGDQPYAQLAGNDVAADVFLGRLSCRSASELAGIVAKIVGYETAPPLDDPSWLSRAVLTADPDPSGVTTIRVSQWLKTRLEARGFAEVDTIWSGNFPLLMFQGLNTGSSLFTYRGIGGMSGLTASYILATDSGGRLPFAVFPTCGAGDFDAETTARSEAFLRNPHGGAVGAISLATNGTHTRYNNCLFQGIFQTLLLGDDPRQGVALEGGKREVHRQYQDHEPDVVAVWAHWTNLMGDPATAVWLGPPAQLRATVPDTLPTESRIVPVIVTTDHGPAAGACVAWTDREGTRAVGLTDARGELMLSIPEVRAGSYDLTIWGVDLLPVQRRVTVGPRARHLESESLGMSLQVGATGSLSLSVANLGVTSVPFATATLTSEDPHVTVTRGIAELHDLLPGTSTFGPTAFEVGTAPTAPTGMRPDLRLTVATHDTSWTGRVDAVLDGWSPRLLASTWSPAGSLRPGSAGSLRLDLVNDGAFPAVGLSARLHTDCPWITITDSTAVYDDLPAHGESESGAVFALVVAADAFAGLRVPLTLTLADTAGIRRDVDLHLTVGGGDAATAAGPDAYGYYAIHNSDVANPLAPVYDWIEIDPARDGPGTTLGLADHAYDDDATVVVDLPFPFTYYGRTYERISVCSNGWIAPGETSLVTWRNWSLPATGAPDALIAPFWDNLVLESDDDVSVWHDQAGGRFIVEWPARVHRDQSIGPRQRFQAVLHDPLIHTTPTGDAPILFQYHTVDDADDQRGYATVGIQSPDAADGLTYSYYHDLATGAAPLTDGLAVLFTTAEAPSGAICAVSPAQVSARAAPGTRTEVTLEIANTGPTASALAYRIEKDDPATDPVGGKTLEGSVLRLDLPAYPQGGSRRIGVTLEVQGDERAASVLLHLPDGARADTVTALSGAMDTFTASLLSDGTAVLWQSATGLPQDWGAHGNLTVNFDGVEGTARFVYAIIGDGGGTPPHTVNASIFVEPTSSSVIVLSPTGGEIWRAGEERVIRFRANDAVETVRIDLQEREGGDWRTLAHEVTADSGSWIWAVDAEPTAEARVRVTSTSESRVTDVSNMAFRIAGDLSWISMDDADGRVDGGAGTSVTLGLDAAGLAVGIHHADLLILNDAGAAVRVPVEFLVAETPPALRLERNRPNPFNGGTLIVFETHAAGLVELTVFDLRGRRVATLVDAELPADRHERIWDGTDDAGRPLPSGTYLYRVHSAGGALSRKLLLVR